MTTGRSDAPQGNGRDAADDHDPSIVPGLVDPVPAPRADPLGSSPSPPLDMSQDPDRFDPTASLSVVGPLDPARDPDRVPRTGEGESLIDLVGDRGSFEGERDNYTWALGLLGVLAFLALVAYVFGEVLGA